MKKEHRHISLGFTKGSFKEGHHIAYIYNDDAERKRTMSKFLKQGWMEKEKLLYLVDDISPEEMKKELMDIGVAVEENQQDFDIRKGHYWCCPDHYFSSEFMLGLVKGYYENAISQGYAGARGIGEMSWALVEGRSTLPELLEYEARLNHILSDYPLTTICQYDARRFDGALIMDMLSVHPMMIVRGQLVSNPHFVEPEAFLKAYRERRDPGRATQA